MDQFPTAIPLWLEAVLGALVVAGGAVYFRLAGRIAKGQGKVPTGLFREVDLWIAVGFSLYFVIRITAAFGTPQKDLTGREIIEGASFYIGMVALLVGFMAFRGISPLRQFGITSRNPFICLGIAIALILAAHPLILFTEYLTGLAMHGKEQPQNVVEFFLSASQRSDTRTVWLMLFLAVVVAPMAEETIFRGYLYGVLKGKFGTLASGVFTAALFAAMHLDLSALPALFVLALCLTLAYEATGSLLVNIFMHGLFNLSMLLLMLFIAGHPGTT